MFGWKPAGEGEQTEGWSAGYIAVLAVACLPTATSNEFHCCDRWGARAVGIFDRTEPHVSPLAARLLQSPRTCVRLQKARVRAIFRPPELAFWIERSYAAGNRRRRARTTARDRNAPASSHRGKGSPAQQIVTNQTQSRGIERHAECARTKPGHDENRSLSGRWQVAGKSLKILTAQVARSGFPTQADSVTRNSGRRRDPDLA